MKTKSKNRQKSFIIAILFVLSVQSQMIAETVVAPKSSTNSDEPAAGHQPFVADPLRNQYVYSNQHFLTAMPEAGWITGMAFRNDSVSGSPINGTVNLEVRLATTPSLSPLIQLEFARNIGPTYEVVFPRQNIRFQASYTAGTVHPFDLSVRFEKPFYYDPRGANLLIETFVYFRTINPTVDATASFSASTIRGGINEPGAFFPGIAPVVQLTFTPVPEPKALALIMIFGLAFFFRRKGLK